jgi:hypothetical protein
VSRQHIEHALPDSLRASSTFERQPVDHLNTLYGRLLGFGFISLREPVRSQDHEWAEAEIEWLHNVPSLLYMPRGQGELPNRFLTRMICRRIWTISMRNDFSELYVCRVCGLPQDTPPWGEDRMSASFDICPCCGVEFGYEDATPIAAKNYRQQWIAGGAKWLSAKDRPSEWDLENQLAQIPGRFR